MRRLIEKHRLTLVQFAKFAVIGGTAFILDNILVYFAIYALGVDPTLAGFLSFPFVVTYTWIGNRLFTFRDAPQSPKHIQWAKFAALCAIGLVFNRGTYVFAISTLPVSPYTPALSLALGTAVGMFFNFFGSKKLVFR